ncbi:hypothetical protein AYI69_g11186 [Smittium culicis]|uniref:Uncharacterized protein n=1 Tax=Smittium culicis TaxID=133412 RepID=A0A1R1X0I3_9FUNG|nr:hypothetical protein AYI69_g11186 [Smittium culicis]
MLIGYEALILRIQSLSAELENLKRVGNSVNQGEVTTNIRIYAVDAETYKYVSWYLDSKHRACISNHDSDHKLASKSVLAIKNRHPGPCRRGGGI